MEGGSAKGFVIGSCASITSDSLETVYGFELSNYNREILSSPTHKQPFDSERVKCPSKSGEDKMTTKKDIMRPIVGTLALQPLAFLWAGITNINYLENLGLFTIISTIYLIPIYYFYENLGGVPNVQ